MQIKKVGTDENGLMSFDMMVGEALVSRIRVDSVSIDLDFVTFSHKNVGVAIVFIEELDMPIDEIHALCR